MRQLIIVLSVVLLTFGSACGGCAGSRGVIVERRPDTSFITERARFFARTEKGIERVSLDGRERALVFATPEGSASLYVMDTTADQRTFLLGNQNTELFVGDVATGALRKVESLGDRCSAATFSPDGKRFAAARHSDYSLPQTSQKEDDTLYVLDSASLVVTELPRSSESWPQRIEWAEDGSGLYVTMNWEGAPQWITLADGVRHPGVKPAPVPLSGARNRPPECALVPASARWSSTIRMVPRAALTTGRIGRQEDLDALADGGATVVTLKGRKRGFHDYQDDFHDVTATPGCGFVLFEHEGALWVADAKGGAASPILLGGGFLFFER